MDEENNELENGAKIVAKKGARTVETAAKGAIKGIFKRKYILLVVIVAVAIALIVASAIEIMKIDGKENSSDSKNAPAAVSNYLNNATIDENGRISLDKTVQELWDEMKETGNRATEYLDSAEELAKLINAQKATEYLDTRENPDETIDWEAINKDVNSKNVQGIVKLKRALSSGETISMTYVSPSEFQGYIDKYNETGSESDKEEAMKHFTLEETTYGTYNSTGGGNVNLSTATHEDFSTETRAIVDAHKNDFNNSNFKSVISANGGYESYVKSLGGVFTKYAGKNVIANVKTAGELQEVAEYVWGLMTIWGFDYDNNSIKTHYKWGQDATEDVGKRFHSTSNYKCSRGSIDEICAGEKGAMSTVCDAGLDTFLYKTGLTNKRNFSSDLVNNKRSYNLQYITKIEDLQVGDIMNFPGHVAIVGEVDKSSNKVILYDAGSKFIKSGKYKKIFTTSGSTQGKNHKGYGKPGGDYKGYSEWEGIRYFNIEQTTTIGETVSTNTEEVNQETNTKNTNVKYDNGMGNGTAGIAGDTTATATETTTTTTAKKGFVAKIATWNEHSDKLESNDPEVASYDNGTTYSMSTQTVPYQQLVSKYAMPFNYLWAFLVVGQDKDFVFDLAQLVYDSKIEITVHDNETTTTDVITQEYTKTTDMHTTGMVIVNYNYTSSANTEGTEYSSSYTWGPGKVSRSTSGKYKTVNTIVEKNNTVEYALTLADVWCCKYEKQYTYEAPTSTTTSEKTTFDDEINKNDGRKAGDSDPSVNEDRLKYLAVTALKSQTSLNITKTDPRIISSTTTYDHSVTGITQTTQTTTKTSSYTSSPEEYYEKVEKDSEQASFVSLFFKSYSAKTNILGLKDVLFEILESNENTKDMVDLTKYLFYKTTGSNYGVTEFDFSVYNPSDFTEIEPITSSGGSIGWEFTKSYENSSLWKYMQGGHNNYKSTQYIYKCVTEDRKYYIMHDDLGTNNKNRNFGFGVCFYSSETYRHQKYFDKWDIDITSSQYQTYGESKMPVEIADWVSLQIWKETKDTMKKKAINAGVTLEDYQIDVLVDIAYQYGSNTQQIPKILNAYKQYGLNESAIRNSSPAFTKWGDRSKARLNLFITGKYISGTGEVLEPYRYATIDTGNIESVCREVAQMLISRNAHYSSGNMTYKNIKKSYESDTRAVCASYATMVLYRAGLLTETQINPYNYHYTADYPNMLRAAGWTQVSKNDLKPGDVINKPTANGITGHVVIYVGNNTVWDQHSAVVSTRGKSPTGKGYSATKYINDSGYIAWRAPQNQ